MSRCSTPAPVVLLIAPRARQNLVTRRFTAGISSAKCARRWPEVLSSMKEALLFEARLALEDGTVFHGRGFGAELRGDGAHGEVVFNTALTGYEEIITDPSYCGQIVVMTAPEMGNVGWNAADLEADRTHASAFVVRELSP